jgi:formamidase
MKSIEIDRSKRLQQEPEKGHNRWHPDIPAVLEADQGEEVVLQTRDALDLQIVHGMTGEDLQYMEGGAAHALTGPVWVKGAKPGDMLEVEFLDIIPESYAWTFFRPGSGFLRDYFPEPYLVHWDIKDGWATSPQIPGVRIPDGSFMGVSGIAPSRTQLVEWTRREADLRASGGIANPPTKDYAIPRAEPMASEGLRTGPPRENCGNVDIKQLTKGSKLFLPVNVDGALFSTGDAHFAQGDGEVCIAAVEMSATAAVRFKVLEGQAARNNIRWPRFSHSGYFNAPEWAAPRNFVATMGMPIGDDGSNDGENLTMAARNAILNMIDLLQERGFTREQAYVICSVAVDLRIGNAVDLPNVTATALLPEAIFG